MLGHQRPRASQPRRLYAVFMHPPGLPHGTFMHLGVSPHAERTFPMGDLISILAGALIFALFLLYVPACERV